MPKQEDKMSDVRFKEICAQFKGEETGLRSKDGRTLYCDETTERGRGAQMVSRAIAETYGSDVLTQVYARVGLEGPERRGAKVVKQAVAEQFGPDLAAKIFQSVSTRTENWRNVNDEVRGRDLREIQKDMDLLQTRPDDFFLRLAQGEMRKLKAGNALSEEEIKTLGQYVFANCNEGMKEMTLCAADTPTEVLNIIQKAAEATADDIRARTEKALTSTSNWLSCKMVSDETEAAKAYGEIIEFLSWAAQNPTHASKDVVAAIWSTIVGNFGARGEIEIVGQYVFENFIKGMPEVTLCAADTPTEVLHIIQEVAEATAANIRARTVKALAATSAWLYCKKVSDETEAAEVYEAVYGEIIEFLPWAAQNPTYVPKDMVAAIWSTTAKLGLHDAGTKSGQHDVGSYLGVPALVWEEH
jgi:hypothetical protein